MSAVLALVPIDLPAMNACYESGAELIPSNSSAWPQPLCIANLPGLDTETTTNRVINGLRQLFMTGHTMQGRTSLPWV